jgi:hypothetical protein
MPASIWPIQGEAMTETDSTSSDEGLWRKASAAGLDRKTFLRMMTVGGSAAVGATLAGFPRSSVAQAPLRLFFKADYPEYFHKPWATELGARWFDFTSYITPIERFFVRNRYASPAVNVATWSLKVHEHRPPRRSRVGIGRVVRSGPGAGRRSPGDTGTGDLRPPMCSVSRRDR